MFLERPTEMLGQQRQHHGDGVELKTKGHGCPMVGMNTLSSSKEVLMVLTGG